MNVVFADSFYFFALFNARDEAHSQANAFSQTFRGRLPTTAWVLTELADGFARSAQRSRLPIFVKTLYAEPRHIIVPPSLPLFQEGLELYERHLDKAWSLTDCISFVVMQRQGIMEALTGDRHFQEAGFVALLTSTK